MRPLFSKSPSLLSSLTTIDESLEFPPAESIIPILSTLHTLLSFHTSLFIDLWDYTNLPFYLAHPNTMVKSLVAHCIKIIDGLTDSQFQLLLTRVFGSEEKLILPGSPTGQNDERLKGVHQVIELTTNWSHHHTDPCSLRMFELSLSRSMFQAQMFLPLPDTTSISTSSSLSSSTTSQSIESSSSLLPFYITEKDLSCHVVSAAGILLPKRFTSLTPSTTPYNTTTTTFTSTSSSNTITGNSSFVYTRTALKNLHKLAVSMNLPGGILLSGSGKTGLVKELARITNRQDQLFVLSLSPTTDTKPLFGHYSTSASPGSFTFVLGALTRALVRGDWVLLEDYHIAPTEFKNALLPILEGAGINIPGRSQVFKIGRDAKIFVTVGITSSGHGRGITNSHSNAIMMNESGQWNKVYCQPLDDTEMISVLETLFPPLKDWGKRILDVTSLIQSKYKGHLPPPSFRTLLTWCHCAMIIHGSSDLDIAEELFLESRDSICGRILNPDIRSQVWKSIGELLGLGSSRMDFFMISYVPQLTTTNHSITIGRLSLPILKPFNERPISMTSSKSFAYTDPVLTLLETLGISIVTGDPTLLVGETGTGKTTTISHLAELLGVELIVINLSQQSDITDLMGGWKTTDINKLGRNLVQEFQDLFKETFDVMKNQTYLDGLRKLVKRQSDGWDKIIRVLEDGGQKALLKLENSIKKSTITSSSSSTSTSNSNSTHERPKKKAKRQTDSTLLLTRWNKFMTQSLPHFRLSLSKSQSNLLFSFEEGLLPMAIQRGDWVLLDEMNLADSGVLEALLPLLERNGSLTLTDRGDDTPLYRHSGFRLFGCMNPATDVGKRELPSSIRDRMVEVNVDMVKTRDGLERIVKGYLKGWIHHSEGNRVIGSILDFWFQVIHLMETTGLFDGSGEKLHFSLRTLSRACHFGVSIAQQIGLRQGILEGLEMCFGRDGPISQILDKTIGPPSRIHRQPTSLTSSTTIPTSNGISVNSINTHSLENNLSDEVYIEGWRLPVGPLPLKTTSSYILTPSVKQNLRILARGIVSGNPILIQGPTSAGKTSLVQYIGERTGNKVVRVNNHEHTDIAEYLGMWSGDGNGDEVKMNDSKDQEMISNGGGIVWKDGILVKALREGSWIILDELNLAPTDVLEALNRLLDDHGEVLIPETGEVIKPTPGFRIFATQNPAGGIYGGRKKLSRALKGRFLSIDMKEIPGEEVETILSGR